MTQTKDGLLSAFENYRLPEDLSGIVAEGQASAYGNILTTPADRLPELFNRYYIYNFSQASSQTICAASETSRYPGQDCLSDPVQIRANLKTMITAASALCLIAEKIRNSPHMDLGGMTEKSREFFDKYTQGEVHPKIILWFGFSMGNGEKAREADIIDALRQMAKIPDDSLLANMHDAIAKSRRPTPSGRHQYGGSADDRRRQQQMQMQK